MRRVTLAALCAATMAGTMLVAAAPADAQPTRPRTDVRADRRATAESIAAQYAAEQFRAARIGDETTRRLLDENEAQRRRVAAVLKDARATAAQRDAARAQLKELDRQLNEVNAKLMASQQTSDELRAQLREYQRQITDAVDTASPEVAAAYELYAEGDRDTAYEVIDRLSQVEAAAAKRAGEIRAGALLRRPAMLAFDRRDRGEMTLAQVIGAWERAQAGDPGFTEGWVDLTALYIEAGRLADARKAAEQAVSTADTDTKRGRGNGMLGEVLLAMGDSRGADAAWEAGLKQLRAAYAVAPDDDDTSRGLIAILDRVGDKQSSELDYVSAARTYSEELQICRKRATARPEVTKVQRDLMVCLSKIGDAYLQAESWPAAKAAFEETLAITEKVLATEPDNLGYQRENAMAQLKLAEYWLAVLRSDAARPLLDKALATMRRLSQADTTSALARRDYSMALEFRARVVPTRTAAGLAEYRTLMDEALRVRRELVAADPASVAAQRDLAVGLHAYALVHADRGDGPTARRALEEALGLYRRIAAAETANGYDQRRVGLVLSELTQVVHAANPAEAAPMLEETLQIQHKLADGNPENATVQQDLGNTLFWSAEQRELARDFEGALARYTEAANYFRKAQRLSVSDADIARRLAVALKYAGDAGYVLKRYDGVRAAYDEAVALFDQLLRNHPEDARAHKDFWMTLYAWSSMTDSPRVWADVVRFMEAADKKGFLTAEDKEKLAAAREHARRSAAKAAASPTPSAAPAQPSTGAPQR